MAAGRKTGGKDFSPGQPSANPEGRPAVAPELRALKKLSAKELEDSISFVMNASYGEVLATAEDVTRPMYLQTIAKILVKAYQAADMLVFDKLLDRCIGKVKEKIEHEIRRPSILVKKDGTEYEFTTLPVKKKIEGDA